MERGENKTTINNPVMLQLWAKIPTSNESLRKGEKGMSETGAKTRFHLSRGEANSGFPAVLYGWFNPGR